MHSDVQPFIACSGEFFVRRLERKEEGSNPVDTQDSHPPKGEKSPTRDLSLFELIIDNECVLMHELTGFNGASKWSHSSGTYRPKGDLMPLVERYLKTQFKGLNIRAMTCDDDHLQEAKKQQAEIKKKEGQGVIYMQGDNSSSSSMSSSDASDLEGRVQDAAREEEREAEEEEKQEKRSPIERLKHPRQGLADWATGE